MNQILLNKISHIFLVTTKLFRGWKILIVDEEPFKNTFWDELIFFRISSFVVVDDAAFVVGEKFTKLKQRRFPVVETLVLQHEKVAAYSVMLGEMVNLWKDRAFAIRGNVQWLGWRGTHLCADIYC